MMRRVASTYKLVQFGACLFHESDTGYVARPYSFFLFPTNGEVRMDASSIGFLRSHNMDFNKWIYEGIPFLSRAKAEQLRASLFPVEKKDDTRTPIVLSQQTDIEETGTALAGLRAWFEEKKEETLYEVMTTNPFLRRYLHEQVAANYPDLVTESRPAPRGRKTLVVLRLSEEEKAERAASLLREKETEYNNNVGFLRIFTALANAKRPLVGHNCMYDLLFMMSHFEGPLPESYAEFTSTVASRFPLVMDTKLLAQSDPFKFALETAVPRASGGSETATPGTAALGGNTPAAAPVREEGAKVLRFGSTSLGELFRVVQEEEDEVRTSERQTTVSLASGFERYAQPAPHEAGYDAYMTGYIFAHMEHALSKHAAVLGNRIPMFKGLFDFDLSGSVPRLESVYLHITGMKGRRPPDLRKVFEHIKMADGQPAPVDVRFVDENSSFAILPEECRSDVSSMLAKPDGRVAGGFTLTPYEEWYAMEIAALTAEQDLACVAGRGAKRAKLS